MTKAQAEPAHDPLDEASAWLLRLRSGEAAPDDADAFARWCADRPQAAHLLRDTWGALRTAAAELAQEERTAAAWANVAKRERTIRTGRRAFVGFAVAAGASWLTLRPPMALWPSLADLAADYRTGTGEQRQVALAANVTVELNTQTRVDVLPASVAARGVEVVAGEAEIDAAAPSGGAAALRPVVVVAGGGRMQATVARFNVRRTGAQVCVTCLSGTVALAHPRGARTLRADDQVIYDDRGVRPVSRVDPGAVSAWRRGMLVFNGVPLADVVDEINRYRRGKVVLRSAALGANRIQAQFPIARLDDVIDMVGRLYGAHVTHLPGNIVLLS
ncbi:iron dicitrate transport regulator FecR [Burkholderia stagnalis]|uniref:FecR family protein n=1 Tax=Burkholderia stagnalis TaxID=1503054 RepID=UPI00075D5E13|nr:FecR domain-containing protein [Burkholderia stagnalis]AOK56626.1 iron dicitrate transport regulator FecR [Burkholderia stagnalis]KVN78510.1 iron dicitrate transport regulator FecR [Burkholderia stagnalis]KWO25185.1 iron dicitrate transport regulator FecR [Burkholderia stagnalis]KWO28791.1 iron dicitrate transport regulator FecR [Burkholderia stagnalis]